MEKSYRKRSQLDLHKEYEAKSEPIVRFLWPRAARKAGLGIHFE